MVAPFKYELLNVSGRPPIKWMTTLIDKKGGIPRDIYLGCSFGNNQITETSSITLDGKTLLEPVVMELACFNKAVINPGSLFHNAPKDIAELIDQINLPEQFSRLQSGDGSTELARLNKPWLDSINIELSQEHTGKLDIPSRRALAVIDLLSSSPNLELTQLLAEQIGTYGMIIQETVSRHINIDDALVLCLPEKMAELITQCLKQYRSTGNDHFQLTQELAAQLTNMNQLVGTLKSGKNIIEPKKIKLIRIGNKGDRLQLYEIYKAFQDSHITPLPLGIFIDRY